MVLPSQAPTVCSGVLDIRIHPFVGGPLRILTPPPAGRPVRPAHRLQITAAGTSGAAGEGLRVSMRSLLSCPRLHWHRCSDSLWCRFGGQTVHDFQSVPAEWPRGRSLPTFRAKRRPAQHLYVTALGTRARHLPGHRFITMPGVGAGQGGSQEGQPARQAVSQSVNQPATSHDF